MKLIVILTGLVISSAALAEPCGTKFEEGSAGWRKSYTYNDTSKKSAKTSADREAWLKSAEKAMLDFLYDSTDHKQPGSHPDIPEMVFAAAQGVTVTVTQVALQNSLKNTIPLNYTTDVTKQGYHYDQVPEIRISGLGKSGILTGTLLLPVSAHNGIDNARKWAKTDRYSLYLEDLNGNPLVTLAEDALSKGMVTVQEVSMKLVKGKKYRIAYYRLGRSNGGGAPGGYPDGRLIELVWDGT